MGGPHAPPPPHDWRLKKPMSNRVKKPESANIKTPGILHSGDFFGPFFPKTLTTETKCMILVILLKIYLMKKLAKNLKFC